MKARETDRDALNCARICEGKRYCYTIREDGRVIRTRRNSLKESRAKVTAKNGKAWVYIGRIAYRLDSLVARHFIKGYRLNDVIEHINGKEKDCAIWNLRVVPRSEYNKGRSRNGLCRPVMANGVVYPSVQACAKALFVTPSTLHDYLKGKYAQTMLDGCDIRLVSAEETGGKYET
jgi:hypothetical protein